MQEDTSPETATETAPETPPEASTGTSDPPIQTDDSEPDAEPETKAEPPTDSEAKTEAKTENDGDEAKTENDGDEAKTEKDGDEESQGIDPQLIAVCGLLWLVACVILLFQWQGLKEDWYLGNIKESLDVHERPDKEAMDEIVAMGPEVVPKLKAELENTQQTDQRYRSVIVSMAGRIPGKESFELLKQAARDLDPRVRANAYVALGKRGEVGSDEEREEAYRILLWALGQEREPQAKAFAARMLGAYPRASWPLIVSLIQSPVGVEPFIPFRRACVESLRQISRKTPDDLPFDLKGTLEVQDQGIKRFEEWFQSTGGTIPEGKDVESYRTSQKRQEQESFWISKEPEDTTSTEWHGWNVLRSADLDEQVAEESVVALVAAGTKTPQPLLSMILVLRDSPKVADRTRCLNALRKVSGKDLPFEVEAPSDRRDLQLVAWEEWFTKIGGQIPEGEDVRSVRAKAREAEQKTEAPSDPPADAKTKESGSK